MSDTLYSVVLDGVVLDGFNAQETQEHLAKLFKIQPNIAARMLCGKSMTVKKGVDHLTAEKYLKALEGAGVKCRIEELVFEIELTRTPSPVHDYVAVENTNSALKPGSIQEIQSYDASMKTGASGSLGRKWRIDAVMKLTKDIIGLAAKRIAVLVDKIRLETLRRADGTKLGGHLAQHFNKILILAGAFVLFSAIVFFKDHNSSNPNDTNTQQEGGEVPAVMMYSKEGAEQALVRLQNRFDSISDTRCLRQTRKLNAGAALKFYQMGNYPQAVDKALQIESMLDRVGC